MPAEVVADASFIAKVYFPEEGSAAARRVVGSGVGLVAPDFLFLEMASIAAKVVRRGRVDHRVAAAAVASSAAMITRSVLSADLAEAAFLIAAEHGFSAYDSAYLELARREQLILITADLKLVRKAEAAGLTGLVEDLQDYDRRTG